MRRITRIRREHARERADRAHPRRERSERMRAAVRHVRAMCTDVIRRGTTRRIPAGLATAIHALRNADRVSAASSVRRAAVARTSRVLRSLRRTSVCARHDAARTNLSAIAPRAERT